ncbi:MAG: hypothetical protein IBJ09_13080 [Bacteroidia bacterium]|nr:hypothetical protein [Bacteroidia bacterium]
MIIDTNTNLQLTPVPIERADSSAKTQFTVYYNQGPSTPKVATTMFKDVLPILTLLLGIGLNRGLDYFSNKRKIRKAGKRWITELTHLELPIKNQINILDDFLKENNKENFLTPDLSIIKPLDCEDFKLLDKSDLVKYFEKINREKYENATILSSEINTFIAILKSQHESLKEKFNEYKKEISLRHTLISKTLQNITSEYTRYVFAIEKEIGTTPDNDPRIKPMYELFTAQISPYSKSGNFNMYCLQAEFLVPLLEILSELRHDDRVTQITNYVIEGRIIINEMIMEKHYLSENFTKIRTEYGSCLRQLKQIMQKI